MIWGLFTHFHLRILISFFSLASSGSFDSDETILTDADNNNDDNENDDDDDERIPFTSFAQARTGRAHKEPT